MTVAELMRYALTELGEDTTVISELGWTPKYWSYSTFRDYTLLAVRATMRDSRIQIKDISFSATVFYDTELNTMPLLPNGKLTYRLYPTPQFAVDDSASAVYFYIDSDSYEPKTLFCDGERLKIVEQEYMDMAVHLWREAVGTPVYAVLQGVSQTATGETTPDHSDDIEITASSMQVSGDILDASEIPLPEKLMRAAKYNICSQALSKIGIEEDLARSERYRFLYEEQVRLFDVDNLSGNIPVVRADAGYP